MKTNISKRDRKHSQKCEDITKNTVGKQASFKNSQNSTGKDQISTLN